MSPIICAASVVPLSLSSLVGQTKPLGEWDCPLRPENAAWLKPKYTLTLLMPQPMASNESNPWIQEAHHDWPILLVLTIVCIILRIVLIHVILKPRYAAAGVPQVRSSTQDHVPSVHPPPPRPPAKHMDKRTPKDRIWQTWLQCTCNLAWNDLMFNWF